MGHLLGYARVSTGDQDAHLKHDALTKAGCYRIFTDTAFGALESRPEHMDNLAIVINYQAFLIDYFFQK